MGFFGTFVHDATGWRPHPPRQAPTRPDPWLMVDIHDSDFTTVTYSPRGRGTGVAYLGFTPRDYFEDETASTPTDVAREAAGLTDWWASAVPGAHDSRRAEKEALIRTFLAGDDADPNPAVLSDDTIAQFADEDIFVELRTARFLRALDLPVPDDLPG